MVPSKEERWLFGGFCDATLSAGADTIRFPKKKGKAVEVGRTGRIFFDCVCDRVLFLFICAAQYDSMQYIL